MSGDNVDLEQIVLTVLEGKSKELSVIQCQWVSTQIWKGQKRQSELKETELEISNTKRIQRITAHFR